MTTLVDIKNALFTHFMTRSSFSIPEDHKSVKIDPKDKSPVFEENKELIIRKALDDFEKATLVVKITDKLYVLTQPLSQLNQQVNLSPLTALMLSHIVNDWMVMTGERQETGYVVNQLAITDRDIQALCHIHHQMMERGELMDDDENEEGLPTKEATP